MDFPRRRLVIGLLLFAAAFDVAYWVVWFTHRSLLASSTDKAYESFENAFPLADGWLAICCLLAARALHRRTSSALLWLLCAGSAGMYLACMDVLYDLENDIWWEGGGGGLVELGINVLTVAGSVLALVLGWRHRAELLD
ncbi:MAG TPA: hypothetical protein VM097_10040 [Mycobacteriales bacterium]|nr:hypothetical protein [Mycobacteriales bacterium]